MTAGTTPGRAVVAGIRVRGTDRKLYSARRLTPEQRDRAIDAAARAPSTPTCASTCASTAMTRAWTTERLSDPMEPLR